MKKQTPALELAPEAMAPDWEMTTQDWFAVVGASLGAFMAILDIQITNASVREIQGALGLDFSESGWISTAYLIAEIIIIPLTAFFSKVFGMRRYALYNCFFFILSSIFCGMSWNLHSLIFARVLQGLSGGTLIPLAFQTLLLYMPPHRKNFGLAILGIIATLAPTLGPSIGGWLTDTYSWRSIFLINIFPGILMMGAIRYGMPDAKIALARLRLIDKWGAITLILGLGALTYVLEDGARLEWFEDDSIKICFLMALVMIPSFIATQVLGKNPLLNLKLLAQRNFGFSAVITMLATTALYGGVYTLSLYLGQIQGYTAQNIGKVMMWVGLPQLLIMPLIPALLKRVDARILAVIGLSLFAFSNFLNTHLNTDYSGDQFIFSLVIRAIGQPLFIIPLSSIGMATITASEVANASSIYNVLRNLGASLGIALAGTFAISRQNLHFQRHMDQIAATDFAFMDRLRSLQLYLMSQGGTDMVQAKNQALALLIGLSHRESLIQAFSDVFLILSLGVGACIVFTLFIKKIKNFSADHSVH